MGRYIVLILVLDIFLVSFSVSTSCPYQHPNCKCEQTKVTCVGISEMPQLKTGSDVTAVTEVHFKNGFISNIPSNSLPPDLISLVFEEHPLTNISDDAFQASVNTLNQLKITHAKFSRLPVALSKLTNLISLTISYTIMYAWNVSILQQFGSTLKIFAAVDVDLNSWPTWLTYFNSLTVLDLSGNSIQFVPDDAFIPFNDTLTQLILSDCKLTQVPNALSVLRSLTSLDLSSNIIRDVNDRPGIEQLRAFPCASTLQVLNIGSTGLKIMPNFSNILTLQNLDVGSNGITLIAGSLPPGLTSLTLYFNWLTSVPADITELPRLTYLDFRHNRLTRINLDQIPPSVVTLHLSNNGITSIIGRTSGTTSHLRDLDLAFNLMSDISSTAFNNLPSLTFLNLYERIRHIPLALTSLTGLKILILTTYLDCPQPPPKELVYWYKSLVQPNITGTCSTGERADDYLRACYRNYTCGACTLVSTVYCSFFFLLAFIAYFFL